MKVKFLDYEDGRTRHNKKVARQNLEKVREYFKNNPDAMMKDAAQDLEMTQKTVRVHLKTIFTENGG